MFKLNRRNKKHSKRGRASSRETSVEKLLRVLGDGHWHRTGELVRRVGHSFAVAKFMLTHGWRPRGLKHAPRISYEITVERDELARPQFRYRLLARND